MTNYERKKTFSEQQNPPRILEGEKKSCASSYQVFKGITDCTGLCVVITLKWEVYNEKMESFIAPFNTDIIFVNF